MIGTGQDIQVRLWIAPQEFWEAALAIGDTVNIQNDNQTYMLKTIVNPGRLIQALEKGHG
jgi:hypothetical protein